MDLNKLVQYLKSTKSCLNLESMFNCSIDEKKRTVYITEIGNGLKLVIDFNSPIAVVDVKLFSSNEIDHDTRSKEDLLTTLLSKEFVNLPSESLFTALMSGESDEASKIGLEQLLFSHRGNLDEKNLKQLLVSDFVEKKSVADLTRSLLCNKLNNKFIVKIDDEYYFRVVFIDVESAEELNDIIYTILLKSLVIKKELSKFLITTK